MFSDRIPADLSRNRLTQTVERLRAARKPFIDLTESNPTRAGFEYPADLLAPLAHPRGLVYAPEPFGLIEARRAVASEYARRGLNVAPERIILTASTSDAYTLLFKLLGNPGDEVLVPRPSYPLFDHLTRLDALVARPYDLEYHGRWSIDMDSVDLALTPRTRALLIVSPNNPTGSFVTADDLDGLVARCAGGGVAFIVDEVFADYELGAGARKTAGAPLNRDDMLSFSLGGLSKSVGLPQVKLGWIAAGGPKPLVDAALERLELVCDTYLAVSTPVQAAAAELLSRGTAVREQIHSRIVANLSRLTVLVERAPACRLLTAEGGWYAVLQVPSVQSEEDLVIDLVENHGVLAHPGFFFDFPREAFLVVSLLVPEPHFSRAAERLLRHFDCTAGDCVRPATHHDA